MKFQITIKNGKRPIKPRAYPTRQDTLLSASLAKYILQTGHSAMALKLENMAGICVKPISGIDRRSPYSSMREAVAHRDPHIEKSQSPSISEWCGGLALLVQRQKRHTHIC